MSEPSAKAIQMVAHAISCDGDFGSRDRLLAYIAALEAVADAARAWHEVQRGTMAAQSPTGLRVADALSALSAARGEHD